MAVIAGAWLGSAAALIAWHRTAPALPDKAWGEAFTRALIPDARDVEITLIPQIAEYEERSVQEERFGFAFFGGDDYYAGQLIIEAHAAFPEADPVLAQWGWENITRLPDGDVQAFATDWTLWMTRLYADDETIEISVYRRTPEVVVWVTSAAWLAGAGWGFAVGRRAGATTLGRWGLGLSAPAGILSTMVIGFQAFNGADVMPAIPWDPYMYWGPRPLSIVGLVLLLSVVVKWVGRSGARIDGGRPAADGPAAPWPG
ncbi:hypothetical protein FB565_008934 [Actinoplanes lutulentus]|uniref:Uncharacterized protein n=1 Tax=Actinoplanes lutulentus TaxID=1287878 RepID=A0A327Z804_9ACTN|nr:hypothetical protein [Actinoplanes lutulentus]MBB2949129.1 hypothetical protein [Actinoplanes lutulentus]RAK31450.1 hypothetical protein B0I29_115257 [Actinoplanes lutulentus]